MKKYIPVLCIVFLGLVLSYATINKAENGIKTHLNGTQVEEIYLPPLYGDKVFNNAIFKTGDWKILNIWASWCVPCHIEHAYLKQLSKIVPIYGITYRDIPTDSKAFLNKMGNVYTKVGVDINGDVSIPLGVVSVPETYVIDKYGVIQFKYVGALNQRIINTYIRPLIEDDDE